MIPPICPNNPLFRYRGLGTSPIIPVVTKRGTKMANYRAPLKDMQFLLREVFAVEKLFASMPATAEVTDDLISAILEEAGKISEELLSPINQSGDLEGCHFQDGVVTTPAGFKEAYTAYSNGGWSGLTGEVKYGGQGMPKVLSAMIEEMIFGANSSFALYAILTTGATLTLNQHGSDQLKQTYLPKMYAGTWSGSMCLTEPHAGTDLGILRTRAEENSDGSYRITGTKIFITAGEHDLAENIIHLVLAKRPDAPEGPRGISLFLVPKILVDDAGNLTGHKNCIECGSIEHKMGIKASATCVLNFDGATGFLVGELNQGLSSMFTMMNYERLSMGLQGNGLAESSYQIAAAYAKERLQGRSAGESEPSGRQADPIIVHPDVRRMLLTMRSNILAGRALSLYASSQLDKVKFHPDEAERKRAEQLVSLLVPVQKAYCTDRGFESCVLGQQTLGGHGYVAEWGLEQNVRDARIAQIYEGTNGIQALDLAGRKTVRCEAELMRVLFADIDAFVATCQPVTALGPYISHMQNSKLLLEQATQSLLAGARVNPHAVGAASYAYMELMGLTLYSFMWLRMLSAAQQALLENTGNMDYYDGLIKTGNFFFARLLPRASALVSEIEAGPDTLMDLAVGQF